MSPEDERNIRKQLDADAAQHEATRAELEGYLIQLCGSLKREADFRHRAIESRAKTASSILRKMRAKGVSPASLYQTVGDLIGTRVVVYNLSDANLLHERLMADTGCPLQNRQAENVRLSTGYEAIHINGLIGSYGCEIQ